MALNNQTPRNYVTRRRSMGTPSLDSPNRTLNETFSPEPEQKVFSVRTLLDSVQKHKRHTSSFATETNVYDTPRFTRATVNSEKKSRTSIKKPKKSTPILVNIKKYVTKTPKTAILKSVGEVADVVIDEIRVIKSIRKQRRSSAINDTIASEKKIVKFHSPANMEVSTFTIDVKMQSARKVLRRSFSNAETEKDKEKIAKTLTPEKVEKTKTPGSRKKMPNFTEIHQRHFDKMESITEHAVRKAERAKTLSRSPKVVNKPEVIHIHGPKTEILSNPETVLVATVTPKLVLAQEQMESITEHAVRKAERAKTLSRSPKVVNKPEVIHIHGPKTEILSNPETVLVATVTPKLVLAQEPQPEVLLDSVSEVLDKKEQETIIAQEFESDGAPESVTAIMLEPELKQKLISETVEPMEMVVLDNLSLQSSSSSIFTSPVIQNPFSTHLGIPISKSDLSPLTESELKRASSIVDRSPFAVEVLESFSIRPKSPAMNRRPIAISRIPGKMKTANKNHTITFTQPKFQSKFNTSVLTTSNLNNGNVFVFKANKTVVSKPVATSTEIKPNLKRTKLMVAIKPRPVPIPIRPAKENHVDKVKERQQKHMSLYKSRPDPAVKSRPAVPKNAIAVRTNKRFELQMKFRQMNANN